MSENSSTAMFQITKGGIKMKNMILTLLMFTGVQAFANSPINFQRGYSDISQEVQEAAQQAAVEDCLISVSARIQKYVKSVDYVDQGLVDIYHSFYISTYEHGQRIVEVYEPMYPSYKDTIRATCKRVK